MTLKPVFEVKEAIRYFNKNEICRFVVFISFGFISRLL